MEHAARIPVRRRGLLSTIDDFLQFASPLLNKGVAAEGSRLLSESSVELMTTNHLTPQRIAGGGILLDGSGWGYGCTWFNDPHRGIIAIAMT